MPPHCAAAAALASVMPAGKLSTKPTLVIATAVGLVMTNDSVLTPPGAIGLGLKVLLIDGPPTVKVAVLAVAVPALLVATTKAPLVNTRAIAVALSTLTVISQKLFAGTVAPDKIRDVPRAEALTEPLGQVVAPAGEAVLRSALTMGCG